MFGSYEERFPFESDFLNGDDAKAQVERLSNSPDAPCRFITTPVGLGRFSGHAEAFLLRELHLDLLGHSGPIPFDALRRPEDIRYLSLVRAVDLGETLDHSAFSSLASLTGLDRLACSLVPVCPEWFSPEFTLTSLAGDFPSVERLLLNSRTEALERLDLLNVDADMTDWQCFDKLTWLRLRGAKLQSLSNLAIKFPAVKALIIEAGRTPLEVGPLASLEMLERFKLLGPTRLHGLDALRLPRATECYLSAASGSAFFDLNPGLKWFRVKRFSGGASTGMIERGWDKIGREHGTGDGYIPEDLRG